MYNNKIYKITDINFELSPVSVVDGTESFADYLQHKYSQSIKKHEQPMLVAKVKNKKIFLVPEVCRMVGAE